MKKVLIITAIVLAVIAIASLCVFLIGKFNTEKDLWQDYYGNDDIYGIQLTKEIDDFPGTEFVWEANSVSVKTGSRVNPIIYGFPVWNVFFEDLTGDGFDDICCTVTVNENGVQSDRIVIQDHQNNIGYEISEPGESNYRLKYENGTLVAIKTNASDNGEESRGAIVFNGVLMKFAENEKSETK